MRAPRLKPLLLALIGLSLPAGAFVKTKAGSSPSYGKVRPIGLLSAPVSPLSLSPYLYDPAASLGQDEQKPTPQPAAAVPPAVPPNAGSHVEAASPPEGLPHFVESLVKLGVPPSLTARLEAFLAARHPGEQDAIYHGLKHSQEVADLAARVVGSESLPAGKKILLILSAALHDVDPDRTPNTPARVEATLAHLDSNDEARGLLLDFGTRYGFTAAQVKALIMATDFAMDPPQMKEKQDAFAKAAAEAFPSEPAWALDWGKRLAFVDQSSTYVGSLAQARERVEGLAAEIRAQLDAIGKGPGPSGAAMLADSHKFLAALRQNPLFALLPAEQARNFDGVLAYFEARRTPAAWAAESAPVPARAPPVIYNGITFEVPILSGKGVFLSPQPASISPEARKAPVMRDPNAPFDLRQFRIPHLPLKIATVADKKGFSSPSGTRVLDMPIKFPGTNYRLPRELEPFTRIVQTIINHEHAANPQIDKYYAYLTIDHGQIKKGETQRRPGLHVDGFQGADQPVKVPSERSYIAADRFPTVFYNQVFETDHLDDGKHNFFLDFDRQADERAAFRAEPYGIYLLDAYTVHRADIASEDASRTFLRLTFSVQRFNRLGLTDNPLFEYNFKRRPKGIPPRLTRYEPE